MCGLLKCCANCKYYEHIRVLDDEADWCHCPNRQGIISNDPNYVKSELSGDCKHYKQMTSEVKSLIEPDTWYYIDEDVRDEFIEDLYAVYREMCKVKSHAYVKICDFVKNHPTIKSARCIKFNSESFGVNYRSRYNPIYMFDVINYKDMKQELNKEIINKVIGDISMKSTIENNMFGKMTIDNDPICTEPSIVNQYINKKRATYEQEREQAIQKINEASPVGKAITNFITALKKAGLKDEQLPDFQRLWSHDCLTDTEKAAIKEIHTAYHCAMNKLHETCRECAAILVNCETFEQKMTVLQKYDIIDSDYKLKA